MRILITGANGQLGRELTRRLQGTDFLATDINEMDITNQKMTMDVITTYKPDVVIHSAAYTNVDGAESNADLAYKINAVGTQNVAAACLQCNAKMVYISTDYVFDGKLGRPYNEFDQPNPIGVYARSKYAGEILAKHCLNRLFIVRSAWLFGDGSNFVRNMLKLGRNNNLIKVVNDQYGCPTFCKDLAQGIMQLAETSSYGTYHIVNEGITSWFDFACEIFRLSALHDVKVIPQSSKELARPAQRPPFSALNSIMLKSVLGYNMRPWKEALEEYLKLDH